MKRNILLVEPNYKTKFPPLGLMKIASYHNALGDNIYFYKGINRIVDDFTYWDRIYISTLFTYHWQTTIETIKHYKSLVKGDISRIFVGGIVASLMPEDLWKETGIIPIKGILNTAGIFDDNNLIIEEMIPDYNLFKNSPFNKIGPLFNESQFLEFSPDTNKLEYTLINDSYLGYSTRGCVWNCDFCGVRLLEPQFIEYKGIKPYINGIKEKYGERPHLVLFDNNILASKNLEKVIDDIIDLGFQRGAKFGYKNKVGQMTYKQRHVDFNQGTDARLMNRKNIKLLSKIAIRPLRIAFDNIKYKEIYTKSIILASENGIRNLSNYILYNYNDTPEDFWRRLKINIDLNRKYNLDIYSFPMKYIPLNAKDRSYVNEPNWNWFFIRNVQRILNVLKGTVMTGEDFFYRAFGENKNDFLTILHMPESILMNRGLKPKKEEKDWLNKFNNLTKNEKKELLTILNNNRAHNKLINAILHIKNRKLKNIFEYYTPHKSLPLFDGLN